MVSLSQTESPLSRRLSLSMTLVRVVNGIADKLQQGKTAGSVMSLAVHGAGLPRWVVDMRHEVRKSVHFITSSAHDTSVCTADRGVHASMHASYGAHTLHLSLRLTPALFLAAHTYTSTHLSRCSSHR